MTGDGPREQPDGDGSGLAGGEALRVHGAEWAAMWLGRKFGVKQCETVWVWWIGRSSRWLEDVRDICISEKYEIVSSNYHGGLGQKMKR